MTMIPVNVVVFTLRRTQLNVVVSEHVEEGPQQVVFAFRTHPHINVASSALGRGPIEGVDGTVVQESMRRHIQRIFLSLLHLLAAWSLPKNQLKSS